jgi:hypothetical protein
MDTTPSAPASPAGVSSVRIERRGGFAGLHLHSEHGYEALGPAERKALAHLLQHPPAPPAAAPARRGAPAAADRFHYRVVVTFGDGREQLLDMAEDDMPDALASLVRP